MIIVSIIYCYDKVNKNRIKLINWNKMNYWLLYSFKLVNFIWKPRNLVRHTILYLFKLHILKVKAVHLIHFIINIFEIDWMIWQKFILVSIVYTYLLLFACISNIT